MHRWLKVRPCGNENEIWLAPAGIDLTGTAFPSGLRLLGGSVKPGEPTEKALSCLERLFVAVEEAVAETPLPWGLWAIRYMGVGEAEFRGHHYLRLVPGCVDVEAEGWPHGVSLFHESLSSPDHRQADELAKAVGVFLNEVATKVVLRPQQKPKSPSP